MALNKIQNMLLGITIGDAFGAGYEFLKGGREEVKNTFDFTKYKKHSLDPQNKQGMYTDDTQMSIAICELLLSDKEFNHETLADSFVNCYKRDSIVGYAQGFKAFLDSINSGKEFLEKIKPNSIRNGAAMRAVPLGIVKNIEIVINSATINAEVTHNTPQGIASSICVALMSHYFFHNIKEPSNVYDYIEPHIRKIHPESTDHFKAAYQMEKENAKILFGEENIYKGIPCDGMRTAGAVLYLLSNFDKDIKEALKQAVLLGGDTDSVASITLGIIAMEEGLKDLPSFLLDDLINHEFGKDYIISLGKKLSKKSNLF